jgi:hypothetical protein
MRYALLALAMAAAWAATGCDGGPPPEPAETPRPAGDPTEDEFLELYRQYSARFHDKVTTRLEGMNTPQMAAEALQIWEDVFASHKDLLAERCRAILDELQPAPDLDMAQYVEVASVTRPEDEQRDEDKVVLKHALWSPVNAAAMGVNNFIARLFTATYVAKRSEALSQARVFWEAIDPDVDNPALMLREGPLVFTVKLSRMTDYYRVDEIKFFWPKALGKIQVIQQGAPPGTGETPGGDAPAPEEGEAGEPRG